MQSVTFILPLVPTTVPEDLNQLRLHWKLNYPPPWTLQDNAQYCSMELRVEHNVICDLFHLIVSRNRNRNESANGSTKRGFLLLLLLAMKLEAINATDTALTHSLCTGCNCSRCNKVLHFSPLNPMHSGRRGMKSEGEIRDWLNRSWILFVGFQFLHLLSQQTSTALPQTETQNPPHQSHVMSLVVSWKLVSIRKMFCTVCYFRVLGLKFNWTVLALVVVDVGDHEGRRWWTFIWWWFLPSSLPLHPLQCRHWQPQIP